MKEKNSILKLNIELDENIIDLDPYLRPEKVAKFLDVSCDFIYDRIARKEITS